jgi:hypothetical protein
VDLVDEKIIVWHDSNNKKFNQFKEKINEFHKYIDEDKQQKEYLYETRL